MADASGATQIYAGSTVSSVAWSPDPGLGTPGAQSLIAFHGWKYPKCGQSSLTFVMAYDGSGLTRLSACNKRSGTGHLAADWSPAGTHLMNTTTGDPWAIQLMAADGRGKLMLVTGSRGAWVSSDSASQ